ncbi:MAG: hypothetical protein U0232_30875 [Thermomicrobiales bacterium]
MGTGIVCSISSGRASSTTSENPAPYDILLGQFGRALHPADAPVAAEPGAR